MVPPVEPPPLDECVQSLKNLSPNASHSNTIKQNSELYLSVIGLLCRLKDDQATVQQAWERGGKEDDKVPCPPLHQLPAMSAIVQDPGLFHSLLACLKTPVELDGMSSFATTPGETTPKAHSQHGRMFQASQSQAPNPPVPLMNRKRSLSVATADMDTNPQKAIKTHHSPIPAMKKKVNQSYKGGNGGTTGGVELNLHVVAATVLFAAFEHLDHWPVQLVRAYAEDSFGPRLWVEDDRCALLASNLALTHSATDNKGNEESSTEALDEAEKVSSFYSNFKESDVDTEILEAGHIARPRFMTSGSLEIDVGQHSTNATSPGTPIEPRTVTAESREADSSDSDSGDEEECLLEISAGTVTDSALSKPSGADDSSSSGESDMEVVEMTGLSVDAEAPALPIPDTSSANGTLSQPSKHTYPVRQTFLKRSRVRPRYFGANLNQAHTAISESLSDRLDAKSKQNSRLLLCLPNFVSVPEVRRLTARHLERWMQSPALSGPARTLFTATVSQMRHVDPPLSADFEAIDAILSMRLKANQLNAHVEHVTTIAKNIPTASVSRHLFLRLIRRELEEMDSVSLDQSSSSSMSDELRMIAAVRSVTSPDLASEGLASALLTILANPVDENTAERNDVTATKERHQLVKKLRLLLRRLASVLGPAQFDGCQLVESLLSFDVDAQSWSVDDEENKGRLMFECITLLAMEWSPSEADSRSLHSKGQRKSGQRDTDKNTSSPPGSTIPSLRKKLSMARKLMLSWCCSDYAAMYQREYGTKRSTGASPGTMKRARHDQPDSVGAGTPNFSSILDGESEHNVESLSCLNTMRCVLFMEEPESPLLYSFLHPYEPALSVVDPQLSQERNRIQLCCDYGADLDDEMMRIILQSVSSRASGIDPEMALTLLEHLFHCCRKGRRASLLLSDARLVWELYKLVEFSPSKKILKSVKSSNGNVDAEGGDGAYQKIISTVLDRGDKSVANGSVPKNVDLPRLSYPGMWWRATALALIMCGVSPNGVGAEMWRTHLTLQALIKMTTSNRYRFPTVDCDDQAREIMKTSESELREEESRVTELLFSPPEPTPTKKSKKMKPIVSSFRGSRASARQREKQERLLRLQREKEEAEAKAEAQRRKKLLRAAQKSIMLYDPKHAARKPPRESVALILSVDEMFGLSEVFQQTTSPDFVLMTIGQTSRQSIERAYDWLIPVTSSHPQIINRLPSSASCFLLLRAYGAEGGESSELRKLSAPLLVHVRESLTGKFGENDAVRAADLLLTDVSDRHPDRRRCARRVLEKALSGVGDSDGDGKLESDDCTWLFNILQVPHAAALIADCIQYISRGLAFERGRVLRAFVLALDAYITFAEAGGVSGAWDFASIVYTLVSSRHNVCAESMDRYSDFRSVAVAVVHKEVRTHFEKNPEKDSVSEQAVQVVSCKTADETAGKNEHKSTVFPFALLRAVCVLLGNWRDSDDLDTEQQPSKNAIRDMVNVFLGTQVSYEAKESDNLGLQGATFVATGRKAITVDLWVMLAKSRSDFIARSAALSAPTGILPRLLLCSGLPRASLSAMIERVEKLGRQAPDANKAFGQLLVPSATAEWGAEYIGNRREIARKLLGRLSAYVRAKHTHSETNSSSGFLDWLTEECRGQEKARKSQFKKSSKDEQSSLGYVASPLEVTSVLSGLSEEEEPDGKTEFMASTERDKVALVSRSSSHVLEVPSLGCSDSTLQAFIEDCFHHKHHDSMEKWLQERFNNQFTPMYAQSRVSRKDAEVPSDIGTICLLLVEAIFKNQEQCDDSMTSVVLKWVPLLSQVRGSIPLWRSLFRLHANSSQQLWSLMMGRCVSVWRDNHISECKKWILSVDNEKGLCRSRMAKFLVLTSRQYSIHIHAFSSALETTQPLLTEKEATAAVSLGLECMKEGGGRDGDHDEDINSRNGFPDWLLLLLLIARLGKRHMMLVMDIIVKQLPGEKDSLRRLVCSTVLRLYAYFPHYMDLRNSVLRSLLVEAADALAVEWLQWRSPMDEQLDDMLSALRAHPHQRLVQTVGDMAKDYPLLVLRKLGMFVEILDQDGGDFNNQSTDRRGRVQDDLATPAYARLNGKIVKVSIRYWGSSFNEQLWISVLDIILKVPHQVLFSCGITMGLPKLVHLYLRLIYLHALSRDRNNPARLRGRLLEVLSKYMSSNDDSWEKFRNSPIPGLNREQSTAQVLSLSGLVPHTNARESGPSS